MRKPKLRELVEALRAVLGGPFTVPFPARPSPAPPAYRGKGEFDERECIGCGACAEVCPARAIQVEDCPEVDPPVRRITRHDDRCVFCGLCQTLCTTGKGVRCTPEYDLATFDRASCAVSIEKRLALCEKCGAVITTEDHLRWLARQVGPKRFANPALLLAADRALGIIGEEAPRDPDAPADRPDILRVLCDGCRREVILREAWG